ncbi:MAG: hypothetical protein WDO24_28645 [Pseudomonadota bacterium]
MPTYASGALMRGLSDDQVVKSARTLVERGFRQMKTQLAMPVTPRRRARSRAHVWCARRSAPTSP